MKKLGIIAVLFFMTCGIACAKDNYGFIDLPYIMSKYSVAVSVNKNVKQREAEIQKLLNDANKKLAATKDETVKKSIEDAAKKQIQPKLDSLTAYQKQQNAKIEASLTTAVSKVAKNGNYALILNGNSVAFGAVNVSDLVLRELNQR